MKIVVDARMHKHGGIGTYLTQVTSRLEESEHEWQILGPETLTSSIYSLQEQLELPRKIPPCDLFWSPHFNVPLWPVRAARRIVTIHDLYHLDEGTLEQRLYARLLISRAVHKADQIITISAFSRARLLHYFPEIEEKIVVIPLGCDHLIQEREVHGLPSHYFLFVGNLKPHKNLKVILEALKRHPHFHLVLVGKMKGWESIQHKYPELKGKLHLLGALSDPQLTWVYTHAEALIFPSLYEGWGLPPLEAMRLGCPVLASNAASIPEACGGAALYFDPSDPGALLAQMEALPERRSKLIIAGKAQSGLYTWERTAALHLNLFSPINTLV